MTQETLTSLLGWVNNPDKAVPLALAEFLRWTAYADWIVYIGAMMGIIGCVIFLNFYLKLDSKNEFMNYYSEPPAFMAYFLILLCLLFAACSGFELFQIHYAPRGFLIDAALNHLKP